MFNRLFTHFYINSIISIYVLLGLKLRKDDTNRTETTMQNGCQNVDDDSPMLSKTDICVICVEYKFYILYICAYYILFTYSFNI